jgi:hypothetical protein
MSEITLRDAIAIAAMQVLLVDATSMNNAASNAYDMADALLEERAKLPQGQYNDPRQYTLIEDLLLGGMFVYVALELWFIIFS